MPGAIPDPYPPSEFGGKTQPNRVQPPPHEPLWYERVMLGHTTGDETGNTPVDDGAAWQGLLPPDEQRALREASGALDKGEFDPFKDV
jgi:hypothetical protein